MYQLKTVGHHRHVKAVSFWNKVDWSLSNKQIVEVYGITYTNVTINRQIYAPHTVKNRSEWRSKVLNIMVGKGQHIFVKNYPEQAACRNAAYKLGVKMKMKTVANGFHMKIG